MTKIAKPSRVIGPEDVRVGDYITVTHATEEYIADTCAYEHGRDAKPRRVTMIPEWAGYPMRVTAVCLPFVLVRLVTKSQGSLDLRRHQIAKLSRAYGRKAFKSEKKTSDK